MKEVRIEEVVTFIKATREEAVTLAYEIGGGEVHALHIQREFELTTEKPVGYYVMPTKEWVGLTEDEAIELLPVGDWEVELTLEFAKAIEAKLKDKNMIQLTKN
jgi:hypothetical protein